MRLVKRVHLCECFLNFFGELYVSFFFLAFFYSSPVEYDLKKDPAGILSSSGTTGPSKSNYFPEKIEFP